MSPKQRGGPNDRENLLDPAAAKRIVQKEWNQPDQDEQSHSAVGSTRKPGGDRGDERPEKKLRWRYVGVQGEAILWRTGGEEFSIAKTFGELGDG